MALPKSYLTSFKNLGGIFEAIKSAQAPEKFTTRFLESLDYKSTSDRMVIGLLKTLGFLSADIAAPTDRYFRFLDQTQSEIVLAEAVKESYKDLFQVNIQANSMTKSEVLNKLKTLTQGQYSESVLDKMATTFTTLCNLADFSTKASGTPLPPDETNDEIKDEDKEHLAQGGSVKLGGLHYNIQLILPESRDPKVYDVLFRSLKEHLIN